MNKRISALFAFGVLSTFFIACGPSAQTTTAITISAAASLTDALNEIDGLYISLHPDLNIVTNFASSGTLQTQIENGAPVDVFISAAPTQMDNLQKEGLLINDSRVNILTNRLVVVVPKKSSLAITSFNDLASDKIKRIAVGDPKSVPAGAYAKQAFDKLGITDKISPKEVLAGDVRQVLTYVEGENVDAGIVYATDAMTSNKIKITAGAPADINAKIVYPGAVIKASKNQKAARDYLLFLSTPEAKTVFEKYGFNLAVE